MIIVKCYKIEDNKNEKKNLPSNSNNFKIGTEYPIGWIIIRIFNEKV